MFAGKPNWKCILRAVGVGIAFAGMMVSANALDNPDAPDRVAAFERRAIVFEQKLTATDGGGSATREGAAYERFLDIELNAAYRSLLARTQGPLREALIGSQRQWLKFRDTEFGFIGKHWTPDRNGTSYSLSVAGYRTEMIKYRVIQLLRYSAEYP